MTTREKLLALVQETIDEYYTKNPDGSYTEIPGKRSTVLSVIMEGQNPNIQCVYKGDNGRCCAASRVNPEAAWVEGEVVTNETNIGFFLEGLKMRGIEGDAIDLGLFGLALQRIHDFPPKVHVLISNAFTLVDNCWRE